MDPSQPTMWQGGIQPPSEFRSHSTARVNCEISTDYIQFIYLDLRLSPAAWLLLSSHWSRPHFLKFNSVDSTIEAPKEALGARNVATVTKYVWYTTVSTTDMRYQR